MTTTTLTPDRPGRRPRASLARHILADGFDLVFDFEKSHGSWVHDARSGREYLDFLTFFGSNPIGYNHPKMKDPEFLRAAAPRGAAEAVAVRHLQRRVRAVRGDLRRASPCPPYLQYAFFIEGGALASRTRSRPPSTGRCAATRRKGIAGREGHAGHPLPRGLPRPHAATRCRSPTPTPSRPTTSPSSPGRAIDNPKLRFPVTPEVERDVTAAEERALDADRARPSRTTPTTSPPSSSSRSRPRAATTTSAPSSCRRCERLARENECFFIVDEVQTGVGLTGQDVGARALRHHARRARLRQEDAGLRLPGRARRSTRSRENVFKVPSRINSTWGGGLTDMVRFGALPRDHRRGAAGRERARGGRAPAARPARRCSASWAALMTQRARARADDRLRPARRPSCATRRTERIIENGLLLLTCGVALDPLPARR